MAPSASVKPAETQMGRPMDQVPPRVTAAKPIREPTERSMPPVLITKVRPKASRPTSAASRAISKPLSRLRKRGCQRAKRNTSAKSTRARTHSPFGQMRCSKLGRPASGMAHLPPESGIRHDGDKQDQSLDGLLPGRIHMQKGENRADGTEQHHAQQGAQK